MPRSIHPYPYCVVNEFAAPSEVLLLNHIRLVYSHDPGFSIQCPHPPGCARTFVNFKMYQNHVLVQQTNVVSSEENGEEMSPV